MSWNDDDNDDFNFDFDDLSPEEKEEIEKEQKETRNRIYKSPLYLKSMEVIEIVSAIIESLPENRKDMYAGTLRDSALMLPPKIASAIGSNSWQICMQNASIIRYHAEYLKISCHGLTAFSNVQKEYAQVLRTEMEVFQELFKEWVSTFDLLEREEYSDDWGLFIRPE